MANFDFNDFARDQSMTALITQLADVVHEHGNDALREGITRFRRNNKIDTEEDQAPNFEFNFAARTYEQVLAHCAANGVNLRRCVFVQGDKFFVSRNYDIGDNQVWDEISSPSSVDVQQETSCLSFMDSRKTMVDWPTTLENLNSMITTKLYSEGMMRKCLLRFINHYESSQTEYLKDKDSNLIANFLLSLNSRIDKKAYHKAKLQMAVRLPEETLSAAIMKVRNIAEMIYPNPVVPAQPGIPVLPGAPVQPVVQPAGGAGDPAAPGLPGQAPLLVPDLHPLVNRILINAIISFCRDDIAVPLAAKIKEDHALSRLLDYNHYLRMAMTAELRSNAYPTVPLKFSRKLPPSTHGMMTLNSLMIPEIHPCQQIPPRKQFPARSLEHYFGNYSGPNYAEFPYMEQLPVADALVLQHVPLVPALQPVPPNEDPLYRIDGPNVLPPPHPIVAQPPIPPIIPHTRIPVPVPVPCVTQNADGAVGNTLPVCRNTRNVISWDQVPRGATVITQPDGQYIFVAGEKWYVDNTNVPEVIPMRERPVALPITPSYPQGTGIRGGTRPKSRSGSLQSRPLPIPETNQDQPHGPDHAGEHIYSQLLSMLLQNMSKPSDVPPRGRSIERQNNPNQNRNYSRDRNNPVRDNSRDRQNRDNSGNRQNRNGSGDRYRNQQDNRRQPRRDGSWNRPGYDPSNGPSNRLANDRDRTPSRDRNGYRPSQRPDQRQDRSNSYPSNNYSRPNYQQSPERGRYPSKDRRTVEQIDRDGIMAAKQLSRAGALMNPATPTQKPNWYSREQTPDRRAISRDRSYEAKRLEYQEETLRKKFPEMKRGTNCSPTYNPITNKSCTKCPVQNTHHEFECRKYDRYSHTKCTTCDRFFHHASDCKEIPKYPPRQIDSQSIRSFEEGPN